MSVKTEVVLLKKHDIGAFDGAGKLREMTKVGDFASEIFEKHPLLKQRIIGMIWYRDFILGRLSKEVYERYLTDAYEIEEILGKNPGMLEKIQHESWWQRYLRGETNPTDMISGNIQAFFEVQKFAETNPEIYKKGRLHLHWNLGIQFGEDYIVVGQREFLISLNLRIQFLDTHPEIEAKAREKGYTRDSLFHDDWSKGEGIYGLLNTLQDEE